MANKWWSYRWGLDEGKELLIVKEWSCSMHKLRLRGIFVLTLTDECRLRVFENIVLRRMFEPKRAGGAGGLSKLYDEGFP